LAGFLLGLIHRGKQLLFRVFAKQRRLDSLGDQRFLLFLGSQDVGGALGAGEQVLAVLDVEQGAQRLDATDDLQEVVGLRSDNGVNQVVSRALVAKIDF